MDQQVSPLKHTLIYGLVLGAVISLYQLLLYIFGMFNNNGMSVVVYVFLILGIFYSTKQFRDTRLGGSINYGRAFGAGILTSLFAGIGAGIFTYQLYTFDPGMKEEIIILMQERMLDKGLTSDQIEMQTNIYQQFATPLVMGIGTVISTVIWGGLFSLVISAMVKTPQNPLSQE